MSPLAGNVERVIPFDDANRKLWMHRKGRAITAKL
jgi:hypothetical protein